MKEKYRKITSYPSNKINPFKNSVIEVVNKKIGEKKIFATGKFADSIIDGETGELKGHAVFAKKYEVDKDQFAKLYIKSISAFIDLTRTGLRVLLYILHKMPQDRDYILFDMEEAKEITGYKTDKSVFVGLGELIECDFLARSQKPYLYYINPTIAFNGNRITLINHYKIKNPTDIGRNMNEVGKSAIKMIEQSFESD